MGLYKEPCVQIQLGERRTRTLSKAYKWLFVENVPLLYETVKLVRQLQIEMWLDSSLLLKAFNLKPANSEQQGKMGYIA